MFSISLLPARTHTSEPRPRVPLRSLLEGDSSVLAISAVIISFLKNQSISQVGGKRAARDLGRRVKGIAKLIKHSTRTNSEIKQRKLHLPILKAGQDKRQLTGQYRGDPAPT